MTLETLLRRRIARLGPMSVAEYMAQCLTHPEHGYYTTGRPLGASGDFITAPEISQMFGEMLGLWMAQVWLDQGAPSRFVLAELGPGRGTLMADVLRAGGSVPGFLSAAQVVLVDISPQLRAEQKRALKGHDPVWVDSFDALPAGPLFLLANEYFDCLPVNQYLRRDGQWHERVVVLKDDALAFGVQGIGRMGQALPDDWPDGRMLELCPAATAQAAAVAARVAGDGGAALIVDYGGLGEGGDSLQAVRDHRKVDPLETPGRSDLTAHVDFAALAHAGGAAQVFGPVGQGLLLERLGITGRAQLLARGLSGRALDSHVAAHRRLTHPAEMGDLFKALAFLPPGAAVPPGFDR